MNARLYDRLAATVSILLLAALGLFTFYLAQVAERDRTRARPSQVAPGQPDYYVDRLALMTMTARGDPAYRIEARKLVHVPSDDTTTFESPVMVTLDPARPRVRVTAQQGRLFNPTPTREQEAHLSGNVQLVRDATANAAALNAVTEFAIVLPDQDIVRTDRPVSIRLGAHQLEGTGMELNNRTRQLRLDSKVRAVLQPPAPAAGAAAGQVAR